MYIYIFIFLTEFLLIKKIIIVMLVGEGSCVFHSFPSFVLG